MLPKLVDPGCQHPQEDGHESLVGQAVGALGGVRELHRHIAGALQQAGAGRLELLQIEGALRLRAGVGGQHTQLEPLVGAVLVEGDGGEQSCARARVTSLPCQVGQGLLQVVGVVAHLEAVVQVLPLDQPQQCVGAVAAVGPYDTKRGSYR